MTLRVEQNGHDDDMYQRIVNRSQRSPRLNTTQKCDRTKDDDTITNNFVHEKHGRVANETLFWLMRPLRLVGRKKK